MSSAKKPPRSKVTSGFVVATTDQGQFLGRIEGSTRDKIALRRIDDLSLLHLPADTKRVATADPSLFPPVPFSSDVKADPNERLARLLKLFRDAKETAGERRDWAREHVDNVLPLGDDVDELIHYRYEQHRSQWKEALRALLEDEVASGNDRLLLLALEHDVPIDVRRVAVGVTADHQIAAAIPALCSAVIHKKALALAEEAAKALATIAPERMQFLARIAQPTVAAKLDLASSRELQEYSMLESILRRDRTPAESSGANPDEFRADVMMHLLLGRPVKDYASFFGIGAASSSMHLVSDVRDQARRHFRSLSDKDSPNVYDQALRGAMAQLVLADTSGDGDPDLLEDAARTLARSDSGLLQESVRLLGDGAVRRIVSALCTPLRVERLAEVLQVVATERRSIASMIAPEVRGVLKARDVDAVLRTAALRALAADPSSHAFVAREAGSDLGRTTQHAEALASALVSNEVEIEVGTYSQSARRNLLAQLPSGTSSYAGRIISALARDRGDAQGWQLLSGLELPADWVKDAEFRSALLEWVTLAAKADTSLPMVRRIAESVLQDDGASWFGWTPEFRGAAVTLLTTEASASAVALLSKNAASIESVQERERIIERIVEDVIAREPQLIEIVAAGVSKEELTNQLLSVGSRLEHAIDNLARARRAEQVMLAGKLCRDLLNELERASSAQADNDTLALLLRRLMEDVAVAAPRAMKSDPATERQVQEPEHPPRSGDGKGDDLLSALNGAARLRATQAERDSFAETTIRLLRTFTLDQLRDFVARNRDAIERTGAVGKLPLAVALIEAGAKSQHVIALLGATAGVVGVQVAMAAYAGAPQATVQFVFDAEITLGDLAEAVQERSTRFRELQHDAKSRWSEVAMVAERLTSTAEAIEGLILSYMRVRQVLTAHELVMIEPTLGARRPWEDLTSGAHRIAGGARAGESFEVLTHGIRIATTGDTIVPATVAPILIDESAES